ncbi:MAG TPA: DUF58 domain-containing protein [Candidatus Acidoferrum sp.]|nr:DUF58 domain-containing protein [Candidatus Acidoferrum sp.]
MSSSRPLVPVEVVGRAGAHGRIPFGFGARFFVALLLGFLWLIPAWWAPRLIDAMFVWDALIFAMFVADLLRLPKPAQLEVRRAWEHPPALATTGEVTVAITNFGAADIRCALVDETPASFRAEPPSLLLNVAANQQASGRYAILPRARGDVQLGRAYLKYQSLLGFAQRWAIADTAQGVRVLPDLEQARQQVLHLIRSRQVEMEKRRRRQRGHGREFESLREYRSGDELRDICWTATARRHALTTRIFEIERSQAVWIVLDAGRLTRAEIRQDDSDLRLAKIDYAVNAALSLAQVAGQCGDRVGLLAYGRAIQQNLAVGRGAQHQRNIVDSLALVHGEAAEANHALAARVLLTEQSRRSLVVWITDFAETPTTPEVIEYAMQMTKRHLVVFSAMSQPDLAALAEKNPRTTEEMYRHAAALEIASRRDLLMRGLRQRGVLAFELVPGLLASSLVNQYLDIKERNLL